MHIRAHVKPTAEPEKYCGCAGPEVELGRLQASGEGRGGVTWDAQQTGETTPPGGLGAGPGAGSGGRRWKDTLGRHINKDR